MTRQALAWNGLAVIAAAVIGICIVRLGGSGTPPPIVISDDALAQRIAVEVQGAVATPGLYWLSGDARVQAAIDAAGGSLPDADLSGINLARRLNDEERLEIAVAGQPPVTAGPSVTTRASGSPVAASVSGAKININAASAAELDALPGIGPALAGRIVAYRTQHGSFASVEELSNVSGISTKMVDNLRGLISIGP